VRGVERRGSRGGGEDRGGDRQGGREGHGRASAALRGRADLWGERVQDSRAAVGRRRWSAVVRVRNSRGRGGAGDAERGRGADRFGPWSGAAGEEGAG